MDLEAAATVLLDVIRHLQEDEFRNGPYNHNIALMFICRKFTGFVYNVSLVVTS